MATHPNDRALLAAVGQMIQDMQYLVDHPRMQQKRWVAAGRQWLPTLRLVQENLQLDVEPNAVEGDSRAEAAPESQKLLVQVVGDTSGTYVSINLNEVSQVTVAHEGEQGYRTPRGVHSGFELKDGRRYMTRSAEAQRIVDAMRKLEIDLPS